MPLANENLITLPKAAKLFPCKRPSLTSMHRWALEGSRGVKLESIRIGGFRYTSAEAVQRFIAAMNKDADVPQFV